MTFVFLVLVILACVLLAAVVLIQNPKGGGLSGTFGGFGNQFMGVKQTTDVLEKGTWLFAGILAVLCIVSTLFFSGNTETPASKAVQNINTSGSNTAPLTTNPNATQNPNTTQLPQDSGK